ncbi:MAG: hypothetical protein ACP5N1_00915 [Candidatus Woesearchaeota archaeon]
MDREGSYMIEIYKKETSKSEYLLSCNEIEQTSSNIILELSLEGIIYDPQIYSENHNISEPIMDIILFDKKGLQKVIDIINSTTYLKYKLT